MADGALSNTEKGEPAVSSGYNGRGKLIAVKYSNVTSPLDKGKAHADGDDILDENKIHDTREKAGSAS